MLKKAFMLLTLVLSPVFAQTPCVLDAKAGRVGDCLKSTVPVTNSVAVMQVGDTAPDGYKVSDPTVPRSIQMEFATLEQAQALIALIQYTYPGSVLNTTDYAYQFDYGMRKLVYTSPGGMFTPRLLSISGTVMVGGVAQPVTFSAGWSLNVVRLIYGGSYEMQEQGYPFGNSMLIVFFELGGYQPVWVGGPKQ